MMAKRILVPLSQIEPADSFVIAVGDLARGAGATVRLLHVAEPTTNVVDADGRVVAYADQETRRVEAEARDFLETIALRLDDVPVELAVAWGDPARAILAEAAEFGADLIALGVGGRRRFMLLGGVAEQVFRRADVPVALLRAGRHESGGH
jgi:nucleotide-binding universal stress UspA family protein